MIFQAGGGLAPKRTLPIEWLGNTTGSESARQLIYFKGEDVKKIGEDVKKLTIRNSLGLREVLFDELDKLRAGEAAPQRVNVVAKTAAQIIATVRLEMDLARFQSQMGKLSSAHKALDPVELS